MEKPGKEKSTKAGKNIMSPTEVVALDFVFRKNKKTEFALYSYDEIAKAAETGIENAKKLISKLVLRGYVEKMETPGGRGHVGVPLRVSAAGKEALLDGLSRARLDLWKRVKSMEKKAVKIK
jgi:DNA-binding MarR family transcriptional regulator